MNESTCALKDRNEIYRDYISKLHSKGIDVTMLVPEIAEMAAAMYSRGKLDAYDDVLNKMKTINI